MLLGPDKRSDGELRGLRTDEIVYFSIGDGDRSVKRQGVYHRDVGCKFVIRLLQRGAQLTEGSPIEAIKLGRVRECKDCLLRKQRRL